LSNLA